MPGCSPYAFYLLKQLLPPGEVIHQVIPEIAEGDIKYFLRFGNVTGAPAAESGNQALCVVSVSGEVVDRRCNKLRQRQRKVDKPHVFPQRLAVKLP